MAESDRNGGRGRAIRGGGTHAVLARPADAGASSYCRDRLAAGGRPASAPIVVLADGHADRPAPVADRQGRPGVVVAVGQDTASEPSTDPTADAPADAPATVSTTGDLATVGRTVDDYLTTWSSAGYRPVVCVDSLSGLLEHGTIQGAYRFLYVLRRRLDALEGDLHLHVNPRAHEEEIIRTFLAVADRTVSFGDGGPLP